MPKVPVPLAFPGDFFVLTWDREGETFILETDDDAESSYDLGSDPLEVVELLRLRGCRKRFRESAVDYAREFGAAQGIPSENRVVQILPRDVPKPVLKFYEEQQHEWYPGL